MFYFDHNPRLCLFSVTELPSRYGARFRSLPFTPSGYIHPGSEVHDVIASSLINPRYTDVSCCHSSNHI